MFKKLLLIPLLIAIPVLAKADLNDSPWDFNVYVFDDIGTDNNPYQSDFQGIAGTGQNAYFTGFSLNLLDSPMNTPFSLYSGGNVDWMNGTVSNGGIEFGGNLRLQNFTINGNLSGGGNSVNQNGTINGNVTVGGSFQNNGGTTVNGTIQQNQAFTPTFNHAQAEQTFTNASQFWGGQSPTANWVNQFGEIVVDPLQSGRNIVNLSLGDIDSSWGLSIDGPADAFVIFNIDDTPPSNDDFFKALTLDFTGGLTMEDVLFNFTNAETLSLQGGTYANILAPNADITFSSGALQGILVAENLYGGGQVNLGTFSGFPEDYPNYATPVPEPHQYLLLGGFLAIALMVHKVRRSPARS